MPYQLPTITQATARQAAFYGIGVGQTIAIYESQSAAASVIELSGGFHKVPSIGSSDAPKNEFGSYNKTAQWDGRMSSSLSGMPVLSYIQFKGNKYTGLDGSIIEVPDIYFDVCLINVTQSKNIERTGVLGRNSDILEYINQGNWSVEITAVITAEMPVNNTVQKKTLDCYPYDNMQEILKLITAPVSIEVSCLFLNKLGINYLAIENGVQINQTEGEYGTQRMTIPCISDEPLIIKKANA